MSLRLDPWGRLRWRFLRWADRNGRTIVTTVSRGPGAGLRIANTSVSADYARGENERTVQDALVAELSAGDVFFDIGANVGFFALLAERLVGPSGRVVAVEPHPGVASALRDNIDRNAAAVTVVEAAASDRTGRGRLGVSVHPGGSSLEQTGAPHDVVEFVDVELTTIDAMVDGLIRPPTFIKLDTESGELEALRGADRTLRAHRPTLLIELDAPTRQLLDEKVEPIRGHLKGLGYSVGPLPAAYPNRRWHVIHLVAHPVNVAPGGP